jgi:hypothetical protein
LDNLSQDSDSVFMTSTPNNASTPVLSPSPLQFSTFKSDLLSKSPFNNSNKKQKPLIAPKPVSARLVRDEIQIGLAKSEALDLKPRSGSVDELRTGNSTLNSSFEEYSYESKHHVTQKTLVGQFTSFQKVHPNTSSVRIIAITDI